LSGQIASIAAEIARTKTAIGETEIEILQVTRAREESALTELRLKESEISDLQQQLITASGQVGRVDILAPVSGRVHNMTVTTLGGIVTPASPIMDIIPDTARLIVESQVEPMYVDQLYIGQSTTVRLSAFNQRTTPELNGQVTSISATTTIDQVTGFPFYTVKIEIPADEISRLKGLILVPGMPAEAFMQTDERTVMNYLLKPATDQLNRAFREE
jgi:HlyD family secretion protein